MMYGHVPDAFAQVSLGSRSTWPRTTMLEWLQMRAHLKAKKAALGNPAVWADKKLRAELEASRHLAREMGIGTSTARPPKGGDIDKRRAELMAELFYDKYPEYDPLTKWEEEFLRETEWIDEVLRAHASERDRSVLGLLFRWIVTVEDDERLAERRQRQRERYRGAVAIVSDRRLKSRKNPFYPHPLELVRIAIAVQMMIDNLKRDFEFFASFGGPVPGTESERAFRIREFMRGDRWASRLISFIDELRRIGYVLCRDEQECLSWPLWKSQFDRAAWSTTRAFLAFLFDVSPATIRKDLSEARLRRLYAEIKAHRSLRIFHKRHGHAMSVSVLRSGWYKRLVNGRPDPHDLATTHCRLPRF